MDYMDRILGGALLITILLLFGLLGKLVLKELLTMTNQEFTYESICIP